MPRQTGLRRTEVVAGILVNDSDAVLIADRARAATLREFWEFPGGKVSDGEAALEALRRELHEELGIDVQSARYLTRIEHDYPDLSVGIDFYVVERWHGTPEGREGQRLRWVARRALGTAQLLPADAPVIEALANPEKAAWKSVS